MKRLYVLILLILVASYYVVGKISEDAGYVLLSYKNTTVETSLWIGLLLLVAAVVAFYITIWLLIRILGSFSMVRRWRHNFRHKRSVSKTTSGLIDLVEGNWKNAQKKLSQAAPQSDTPLINYLSAARAAAANNDPEGVELFLKKAHDSTPGAELAIGITKVEIDIQQERYEQALTSLQVLRESHPKHKQVAQLLQQVYVALEDWEALQELAPVLRKLRVASDTRLDDIEKQSALKILARAAQQQTDQNKQECADQLHHAWLRVPAKIRALEDVSRVYAHNMIALADPVRAEAALNETLNTHWSDALAADYGLLQTENTKAQLQTAKGWLKKHPDSAELQLTLGRLSLRNRLWGKAHVHFLDSLKLRETPEAHAELGRLLKHMGEQEAYQSHVQKGFEVVAAGLPKLPMPEKSHSDIA